MPGRILVAAVTTFGAVRFGSRLLAQTASFQLTGLRLPGWLVPAGFVTAIGWASVHLFSSANATLMDWSCRGLGIAASVITADYVVRRRCSDPVRRVDWVGVAALVAGLSAPAYVPHDGGNFSAYRWGSMWLWPSCLIAFLVCLTGRAVQKFWQRIAT